MLSKQQIKAFQSNGVVVVEDVISKDHLRGVKAEYANLMDRLYAQWQEMGWVKPASADMGFWDKLDQAYKAKDFDWYQPFDISLPHDNIKHDTPFHIGAAVFDMMTSPRLLDCVQSLLGPEITSNPIQHVRIKPPERLLPKEEIRAHITATDWHQDRAVTLATADKTEMITVWLAITDATIDNGCLQYLAHKTDDLLPHCIKTQVGIPDQFIDHTQARPLPVKAGGAVIFDPLTPHASLSNKTQGYRWSFDLRYNVTGQSTGRDHFPSFIARSASDPSRELRDWRAYRHMWENVRTQLASKPHIDQHGRWDNSASYCA